MCGIAGFLEIKNKDHNYEVVIAKMTNAIKHRGPDDFGVWNDSNIGITLGHRRLSILDLSSAGHQPMHSLSGRFIIAFNGEIYNFKEIRDKIKLQNWQGSSDTEVLLAAFEEYGIEAALEKVVGMFAIALWDREKKNLYLIRDRMGEKPLYYGWIGESFVFGSDLNAVKTYPQWDGEIDPGVLALFMRHHYIPGPYSIYKNFFKVIPGTFIKIETNNGKVNVHQKNKDKPVKAVEYYSIKNIIETNQVTFTHFDTKQYVETLDALLTQSIQNQVIADVPVGAFLSGGIDSSTVVGIMKKVCQQKVKTFTIGFNEAGYNEANHAKTIAAYYDTDHTEFYVKPEDALAVVPNISKLYSEPFADPSQVPTYLLSHLTRQFVTVSLSGDGGDELFCGYGRYQFTKNLWDKSSWIPSNIRKVLSEGGRGFCNSYSKISSHNNKIVNKVRILSGLFDSPNIEDLYRKVVSDDHPTVHGGYEPTTALTDPLQWPHLKQSCSKLMFLDQISYLPDDILVKVDRAAMGVSLETRMPFLDHRVVEFAWQVPLEMKIREGKNKWLLRQVLHKYLPRNLVERPKSGFSVPIGTWLRGPLRDWADDLLNINKIKNQGFFDPKEIRNKWEIHLSEVFDCSDLLWNVLMFQSWYEDRNQS